MNRREPWRASVGVRTVFGSGERFAFMAVPFLMSTHGVGRNNAEGWWFVPQS